MSSFSEDLDSDVAEPFRFHFEVAYEVANKGTCVCASVRTAVCVVYRMFVRAVPPFPAPFCGSEGRQCVMSYLCALSKRCRLQQNLL